MRTILSILAASTIAVALAACGSSESPGGTTSISTATSGGGGDVSAGSSSSSSGTGGSVDNGKVCMAGNLCLQVKQVDPGGALPSGRVVVVWYPFDDANKTPPLIAYDVPFDATTTRLDIPYVALAPVTDALMLCPRSCMDPTTCPCSGDPALGFARVGVGQDQNHDGKLDAAELEATLHGAGRLGVVYSQKPYHPSPASIASILPDGVNVGTHAYRVIPKSSKTQFDQLGIAFDGTVFDLAICGDTAGCVVPTPKLQ